MTAEEPAHTEEPAQTEEPAPLDMPIEEAMRTQRAIRRLTDEPVDDALVRRLVELATKAPSAQDTQAWEFVVVRDPEVKQRLARLNRFVWRLAKPFLARQHKGDEATERMYRAVEGQVANLEQTPVLVVCCIRGLRFAFPPVLAASHYGSIFPAVQNLLLAARAAGLGANLLTMPLTINWLARRALGLPWNVTPVAVVPLGWPKGRYGPNTRRPVGEITSVDRYGNRAWN